MNKKLSRFLVPFLLIILLIGVGAVFAEDDPPVFVEEPVGNPADVISSPVRNRELAATKEFWTDERLQSAVPLDSIEVDEVPTAFEESAVISPMPFEAIAGLAPQRDAVNWAKEKYPMEWLAVANAVEKGADEAAPTGLDNIDAGQAPEDTRYQPYPPAYNSFYVNRFTSPLTLSWWLYPWSTMGKLYFTIPGVSGTYVCSASVFANRAVWTAGHCTYTAGRGWHTNMIFIPAFRNGAMPYGQWAVVNKASTAGWVNDSNLAYDIGVLIMGNNSGKTIGSVVGSLGSAWGGSIRRLWNHFGYPGNLGSGKYLYVCQGSLSATRTKDGPDPFAIGCNMLGGSSGGPYVYNFVPYFNANKNYVNGVRSFHVSGRAQEGYSPYFGYAAKNLYDWGVAK